MSADMNHPEKDLALTENDFEETIVLEGKQAEAEISETAEAAEGAVQETAEAAENAAAEVQAAAEEAGAQAEEAAAGIPAEAPAAPAPVQERAVKEAGPLSEIPKRKGRTVIRTIALLLILAAVGVGLYFLITAMQNKKAAEATTAETEATTPAAQETTTAAEEETTTPAETEAELVLEKDAHPEVNELVEKYFTAIKNVDIETLQTVLDSNTEISEEQIRKEGEFIEDYQDIHCYTVAGPEEGSYVVYYEYNVKFLNVETPAPALMRSFVHTGANGALCIQNEGISEENMAFIQKVAESKAVKDLISTVDNNFNTAVASDTDLKALVDKLNEAVTGTTAETTAAPETTPAETTEADETSPEETSPEETTEAEETTPEETTEHTTTAETAPIEWEECDEMVFATTDLFIRSKTSTDSESIALILTGTEIQRVGRSEHWSKVIYKGEIGYISAELLSIYPVETTDPAETAGQ